MTGNGQKPPAPGSDDALVQEEFARMISGIAEVVHALAPHLNAEQAGQLTMQAVTEASNISHAIDDSVPGSEAASKHPGWGFQILLPPKKKGDPPQVVGIVHAPKDVRGTQPHEVVAHATVLAIATSPLARAVLRAHGYAIAFFQGPRKEQQGRIVLPGS
jgi:hypothetical protein